MKTKPTCISCEKEITKGPAYSSMKKKGFLCGVCNKKEADG